MPISIEIDRLQKRVDAALDRHLPPADARPKILHEAMRYSIFAGGKRLRPILCLAAAQAVGGEEADALLPAISLEALHTYTLIHDDLPSMDDDSLRRGLPTCHIRFGDANAILAGDALLTLVFQWLATCVAPAPYHPNQLATELTKASGSEGIVAGQVEDLAAEGRQPTANLVEYIHMHKTAALFRAAVRMGGITGSASAGELEALTEYGDSIGLAFQIADDILDEVGTSEDIGKDAGSDREKGKLTYVSLYGVEESRRKADHLLQVALNSLGRMSGDTSLLNELAVRCVNRKS